MAAHAIQDASHGHPGTAPRERSLLRSQIDWVMARLQKSTFYFIGRKDSVSVGIGSQCSGHCT